jgi:hypothetical protein
MRWIRPGTRSTSISSRPLRFAAFAAVVAVAAGWIAYAHVWRNGAAKPLAYRDLTSKLAPLEPPDAAQLLFTRRDELERYVRLVRPGEPLRLPPIDFTRDSALLFTTGPRSSTGYALRVVSAQEDRGRALFRVREETPALGDPQHARLTYPYRLLVFRKLDKPVHLELQGRP